MPRKNFKFIIIICVLVGLFIVGVVIFSKRHIPAPAQTTSTQPSPDPITENKAPSLPAITPVPEPSLPQGTDRFVIGLNDTSNDIATHLGAGGYIGDTAAFLHLLGSTVLAPGAYKIATTMNPPQLIRVLEEKPYMKWVVIPEGLRKEEIADLLAQTLGWTKSQKAAWINKDTVTDTTHIEGVYFPDTYLIPLGETPSDTANRLIAKFNEKFAPYLPEFNAQNIKWTTGLTLASIVQREAANDADMPLIAGILWNRLNAGMPLDVDATLQYVRGDVGQGWWAPIHTADKLTDSPYNTYKNKSLPPHPISNPGLPAIEAVLNPANTDCLYYLHDKDHTTHCAATYEEHQNNIETYLKTQ